MSNESVPLWKLFDGWQGYQSALVGAIRSLTPEQLAFRPAPQLRSVGELAAHISEGRLIWFRRMQPPGIEAAAELTGSDTPDASLYTDAAALVRHFEASWQVIDSALSAWTVADLFVTYRHVYWGRTYAISRQWTIWRIVTHDVHHGGELALMLGMQGIPVPDLGDQFGHLVMPPVVEE